MTKPSPAARARRFTDPARYTPFFSRRRGRLFVEGVPLEAIAARVGTPAYVYSRAAIEAAYHRLDRALGSLPHTLCYAVKANSNLSILRLLARLGSGFDIVSAGELERLRRAGVPAGRAVFSGAGKSREEIREALRQGIGLLNVESEAELELLLSEAARRRRPAPAGIRVNPDVRGGAHPHISTGQHRHKFGVDWPHARRLYRTHRGSRWLRWQGLSAHIGSQILSLGPYRRAIRRLTGYARELAAAGIALRYLDLGGGLGIRYSHETPLDIAGFARAAVAAVRPLGMHLLLEPGRVIVGAAGVLLMRALYTKRTRGHDFLVVDAAMNDFARPVLYDAVHPITPVRAAAGARRRVDVVGPVCETGDRFLAGWPLPHVEPGELLVLWGAGAYGFVLASNYNSRPRPAEVLVSGRSFRIIRRRETLADLIRGE